jgi:hypothetical protein
MARKSYTAEQIIVILRKVEVLCGQGKTVKEAVQQEGITENTYFRWCKEYGGMSTADVKRLKELEKENSRLKRIVADLTLDNEMRPHSSLGGKTPAPPTYTFDDMEMTDALRRSVWNVILVSEKKKEQVA